MISVLLLLFTSLGFALPFDAAQREHYIATALNTIQAASPNILHEAQEFMDDVEKRKCRSFLDGLTLNCLQAAARSKCRTQDCSVIHDVILVNKVNERQFVTKEERVKIAVSTANYESAYQKTLQSKYALLATEFLLKGKACKKSDDVSCFSRNIDTYCQQNSDERNLSWQACVSALIWFRTTR